MARQWRSAGVVVAVDETAQTIRVRDTQLVLNAVGIAFAVTALAPMLIVRLRPIYSLTFAGYVTSGVFGLCALLCLWMLLRHASNDVTIDLKKRVVWASSALFGVRQEAPLDEVRFSMQRTVVEALGNSVRGVVVRVEGAGLAARLLNFTEDQESLVEAFTAIFAGAAEQSPEHTLRRVAAEAEGLPPAMLGQLLGLCALMVGAACWLIATYVLRADR